MRARTASPRRRRLWIGLAAIAVLVGGDYLLGMRSDSVEVTLSEGRPARATLATCGSTTPLEPRLFRASVLRATPPRFCGGPGTVQLTLDNGSIRRCTALHLRPGRDYSVPIGEAGCGGFEETMLPAFP